MWMFSKQLTEYSVTAVLFWIAVAGTILSLPNIGLVYGLHEWTEATFGFGARTIAIDRRGDGLAVRAAQHDPAADADRLLCARPAIARPGSR